MSVKMALVDENALEPSQKTGKNRIINCAGR